MIIKSPRFGYPPSTDHAADLMQHKALALDNKTQKLDSTNGERPLTLPTKEKHGIGCSALLHSNERGCGGGEKPTLNERMYRLADALSFSVRMV